ncbi:1190_t:CDS:1 [Diversispora eburnea]|uniref:1190_t:CDS:1 n=1 Tax=Diversispora eburnea TaxID=1213867 RepID=A0A9N9G2Y0_9GLOM|nr:1190_t:CDS:1 [Diversispora eburnea]
MYNLSERAIEETHQALVYHIKEKLKQHSRHVGNVNITFSCTESQFFEVLKGYKYNYFPKSRTYKCIFRSANSYFTLAHTLKDKKWGIKYFLQYQKTFVLFYQPLPNPDNLDPLQELIEPNLLQESDSLQDKRLLHAKKRICKLRPIQIIIR